MSEAQNPTQSEIPWLCTLLATIILCAVLIGYAKHVAPKPQVQPSPPAHPVVHDGDTRW